METAMLVAIIVVAAILLMVVVLYALTFKNVVRTGVKLGWFSFFFEALGSRGNGERSLERPRRHSTTDLEVPISDRHRG